MTDRIALESSKFQQISEEISKVIVGQKNIIDFMLISLLCEGHCLLEGVPGVAKTSMIKAIADSLNLSFKRVQFTPDLLPSDLIGTSIYNPKLQEFEIKKGPLFAHFILADEINRAPAKVQAALLEAMQEQQVTIGSHTFELPKPFSVFATQNPLEQEGTYKLPEAQLDRFMFKLIVEYPTQSQEKEIIKLVAKHNNISKILNSEDIIQAKEIVKTIYCDDRVLDYIISIVFATRSPQLFGLKDLQKYITYGVSPRASLALNIASKAHAFMQKRHFVTPDDVKAVALPILRHRICLSYEAEIDQIDQDMIVKKILSTIIAP